MPAGFSNPALGYASFCAIKLVGYSLAARVLSQSYGRSDLGSLRVGATRTLIGMATGAAYFGLWALAERYYPSTVKAALDQTVPYLYLVGLLPLRVAEWWLLIWIFYDRGLKERVKGWRMVGLGTIWSYALDAPAVAGFFVTGGFWVC